MIKPIRNYVLAKAFKEDSISRGGIYIPETARGDGSKIEILDVGNGTKKRPMNIRKGIAYRILGSGTPIEHNGEKYYLLEQNTILAYEN